MSSAGEQWRALRAACNTRSATLHLPAEELPGGDRTGAGGRPDPDDASTASTRSAASRGPLSARGGSANQGIRWFRCHAILGTNLSSTNWKKSITRRCVRVQLSCAWGTRRRELELVRTEAIPEGRFEDEDGLVRPGVLQARWLRGPRTVPGDVRPGARRGGAYGSRAHELHATAVELDQ